ncbi:site-specific integrase [Arthrobacter sp. SRS-W-1-2016]|uniref:tyrosine-type recombinase/integrase n=1 Tax=Arthrobacter sp. SRS-W-1-2016 TaxID=1930254 RepID=UPI000990F122|nr:site-specific integrase [Arthrobacter sp. SRS-W-1-2016]
MAYIEDRKRKDGTVTHYVRWTDPDSKQRMAQKMPSKDSAKLLLTVLKAHGNNIDSALESVRAHYRGVYTVSRMIEDHISLLTHSGYTIRRYRGMLRCHIADGIGTMDATKVEYRDVVAWVKDMQLKGLAPKTIKNVHGLISASFKTMVREKHRSDNPCEGMSLPKSLATEESATFLTRDEWTRIRAELCEPYESFFTFLVHTGMRYSEATALEERDFQTTASGQHIVKVVRAWTRDEDNAPVIGPPKTKKSKRTIALTDSVFESLQPLLRKAASRDTFVFVNTAGTPLPHNRAWDAWDLAISKAQAKGLKKKRVRIHDLRHTNASWLLQAGLGIYQLQAHLGHESITTTLDRYSHLMPEALRDTTAAMERAYGANE